MNTLRISLMCGISRPKQLIGLLTLLLLSPAFASAVCSPGQTCLVTSGTVVVEAPVDIPLNFASKDFSASGMFTEVCCLLPYGLLFNFESDPFFESFGATVTDKGLTQLELTIKGVPWGIPAGGDAGFFFLADLGIPAPLGTFSVPFTFEGSFTGAPQPFPAGLGCDVLNCETLNFSGGGILTFDVGEFVDQGVSWFYVGQQTFRFAAAPEPATLSLFALGLVSLAMRRKTS
jgi:hypothetical protein